MNGGVQQAMYSILLLIYSYCISVSSSRVMVLLRVYSPLSHFERSRKRHLFEQNGKEGESVGDFLLHMGQVCSLVDDWLICFFFVAGMVFISVEIFEKSSKLCSLYPMGVIVI